jgi:DNA-binding NarL/FixJ family response regulator
MNVLIVDDHPVVVSGCQALLEQSGDIHTLEASDAQSAMAVYLSEKPDVCIVDVNLPDVSGFELVRRLLNADAKARVLMFSMNDDPMFAARAIECGAKGYVSKTDDPAAFVKAVIRIANGGHALPNEMAQRVAFLRAGTAAESAPLLTAREREVLRLLGKGKKMTEIAELIDVSHKTVATTCASLREKLNARSLVQLVIIAVANEKV